MKQFDQMKDMMKTMQKQSAAGRMIKGFPGK
jgi:signal recognition particle GTPase